MKEKKKLGLGVWIMIGLAAGIAFGAILWAAMGEKLLLILRPAISSPSETSSSTF